MKNLHYAIQRLFGVFLIVITALISYIDRAPAYLLLLPIGLFIVLTNIDLWDFINIREDKHDEEEDWD